VSSKSKFRSELKSHTRRTIEVKTDLNSAVDAYFACMRSGVTENLFSDSLALKVQLSTVISLSTLASGISNRKCSKNPLLSSVAKRVQKSLMIVFEDRQLALGGGTQLSLWLDIVLWGQQSILEMKKAKGNW